MKWATVLRIAIATGLFAAIIACLTILPFPQCIKWSLAWIQSWGAWGPICLVLLYIPVCLLLLPGSALSLAAGFLFGMAWGAVTASLGATLGATAAFVAGRFLVREYVEGGILDHPRFLAIDLAIDGQGFTIVLLTRLCSFFPYGLMSYLFGLTKVPLGRYVVATWLGRLPDILLFSYLGSTAKNLADLAAGKVEGGIERRVLLGVGLVAMIAVAVLIAQIARRALRDAVDKPHQREST
ncbi:MAG: TVP38/TMEM64 family protein [Thermoguttaceae bacterium]|jgi:uncharacterized membrane protein YdjX (TVP38/TMEM64 family)